MKKYRIIKKFPNWPELGTIWEDMDWKFVVRSLRTPMMFNYWEIMPEFMEEIREERILVPNNIKIERSCWHWDKLGIVFNDNKQVLSYFSLYWWIYNVDGASDGDFVQCELIKCKRKDLKPWNTA